MAGPPGPRAPGPGPDATVAAVEVSPPRLLAAQLPVDAEVSVSTARGAASFTYRSSQRSCSHSMWRIDSRAA